MQQCLYTSSAGAAVLLQRCSCSVRLEAVRPSRWAVDLAVAEPPGSRRTLLSSASRRHAPSSGRDAAARHTGSHGKPTAGNRFHRGPAPQCPSRTTPRSAFITGGSMQREQHRLASHAVRTAERPPVVATGGRSLWLLLVRLLATRCRRTESQPARSPTVRAAFRPWRPSPAAHAAGCPRLPPGWPAS